MDRMLVEVLYIGDRLRDSRKRVPFSQEQLSKRSGVVISKVTRTERNQGEPQGRTIRKRAEALDVEPHKLVKGASYVLNECPRPDARRFGVLQP